MNEWLDRAKQWAYVGSRVTCNPAPTDTDQDILVLVEDIAEWRERMIEGGFEVAGSIPAAEKNVLGADQFESYTKDDINLIVTSDAMFFSKFMAATHVAKRLNLLNKNDRKALFQAVLYGNVWGDREVDADEQ